MVHHLEVQDVLVVDLPSLQGELEVEARTVAIWILHPPSFPQRLLELRITARHDEHFLPILQPILALPFLKVGNVRIATHLSRLLLVSVLLVLLAILFFVVLLFLSVLSRPLCLLIELIVIHSIQHILLHRHQHEILQLFLQFFFLHALLLLCLLFLLPLLLYLLQVLFILLLEVLIGLGQLVLCDFDEGLELLS